MNHEVSTGIDKSDQQPEPFWLTSQFSTKELADQLVAIQWLRGKEDVSRGIYQIQVGAWGHSKHIQSIHVALLEGDGNEPHHFDFDQADADLLHRSNENPLKYSFTARLERDRKREQNPLLARIVHERRERKLKDEEGGEPWYIVSDPVLKPTSIPDESWRLPEELERDKT